MKAWHIKFRIRNNTITWLENSLLMAKWNKPKTLGISYFSIIRYKDSFDNGIEEMSPSKFISFLFKKNFKTIQCLIAQEKNGFNFDVYFYELLSMFPEHKLFTLITKFSECMLQITKNYESKWF